MMKGMNHVCCLSSNEISENGSFVHACQTHECILSQTQKSLVLVGLTNVNEIHPAS